MSGLSTDPTAVAPAAEEAEDRVLLRSELLIAGLLRWGVITSFVVVAAGVIALVASSHTGYGQDGLDNVAGLLQYNPEASAFPRSVKGTLSALAAFSPYGIISLGLLLLIAIPVVRVAASIVTFAVERDWQYVLITCFVFAMLMISFALGKAGE